MNKALRAYLRLLAAFTLLAAIGQLAFPARVGLASAWGLAPGWQREIGFWALTMYLMIVLTLRADDPNTGRTIAIGLVTLQFFAATNHAVGAIEGHSLFNAILAVLNYACVAFGLAALRLAMIKKRSNPT